AGVGVLRRHLQLEAVAELQLARFAECGKDLELIGGARLRREVAPQEALNRKLIGAVIALVRIRLRHDRLEHLERPQPLRLRIGADALAPERESQQTLPRTVVAIERDHHRAGSRYRLGPESALRGTNAHHSLPSSIIRHAEGNYEVSDRNVVQPVDPARLPCRLQTAVRVKTAKWPRNPDF